MSSVSYLMFKKIGITGGIGSGKSIVCEMFKILGISIYNADDRAKYLIHNDLQIRAELKEFFGKEAYDSNGNYNRAFIAQQVFGNEAALKVLNAIVHPRVFDDTEKWAKAHQQDAYIIKEAAIMNAAGDGNDLDKVIVVTAPLELRIKRIKQRDPQRSEEEILAIINKQKSAESYLKMADFEIKNDNTEMLIPQVLALHERFTRNLP